jgi:bifunctional pyridoxal-dependent enzyme with beta-cystathionase and maltose regulon repressor activities
MKLTKHTIHVAESEAQAQLILLCLDQRVHEGLFGYSADKRNIQINYNQKRLSQEVENNTQQLVKGVVLAIMHFTKDQTK